VLDSILIDSGPLIALFDSSEKHHTAALEWLRRNPCRYISTLAVCTEVSHMLDFSVRAQCDFYDWVMHRGVILCDINQNDLPRIIEMTRQYADLPMDFADATLMVAAEKTGIRSIISIDRDFDVYRLPGKVRIKNMFLRWD
jgi:predicted nucleic acid-binding protein